MTDIKSKTVEGLPSSRDILGLGNLHRLPVNMIDLARPFEKRTGGAKYLKMQKSDGLL